MPATETGPPSSRYSKWRAATLSLVYLLMAVHIAHWTIAGKTLAPLELNEVMYTFELGIVTAGFVFMAVAVLATSIFGRFFCSWGCHILALQDLSAWLLGKLGIRPKPVRSRAMLWVPIAAALYMFVWPQVLRIAEGRPLARLHLRSDAEGWASFMTEDFWRNLPSPGITVLTFLVCGLVIVYVLGSRGFCAYGCPYGAVFGLADRIAPGRIRLKPGRGCEACGICTAVCGSGVRVHEEIARYGMIVNPRCLKDLDCVAVCPDQGLYYGWGRPSLGKAARSDTPVRRSYDFAWWEEGILALVFLAVLVIFRGLYDRVPFLMTLGLGTVVAYLLVVLVRLAWQPEVRLNRWALKRAGRLSGRGWLFLAAMTAFLIFTFHSALIQYHSLQGRRQYRMARASTPAAAGHLEAALAHLGFVDRWGLMTSERVEHIAAELHARCQNWSEAERHYARWIGQSPDSAAAHAGLGTALGREGRGEAALGELEAALRIDPQRAETHYALAGLLFGSQRHGDAVGHLREAVRLRPDYAQAWLDLGTLMIEKGDLPGGIEHLARAIASDPGLAEAHYNLAVALGMAGRVDEARREIDRALALKPDDAQATAFREHLSGLR